MHPIAAAGVAALLVPAFAGFACAFVGSMPIAGPNAALIFTSGLRRQYAAGLRIAIGAALGEGAYAALAVLGWEALLGPRPALRMIFQGLTAAALLTVGTVLVVRPPTPPLPGEQSVERRGSFVLGLSIAALNPTLLATWTATAAALDGVGLGPFPPRTAFPFALGVAAGIVGWYATLLALLRRYGARVRQTTTTVVIRVTGGLLLVLGAFIAARTASALLRLG